MPIDAFLKKYLLDFEELNSNQQQYVIDCFQLWYSNGILESVYKTHGGAMFDMLENGPTVTCSIKTGNVTIDLASFDREVKSFATYGPISSFANSHGNELNFNLSLVLGFGYQVEFCLTEETRESVRQMYNARHAEKSTQTSVGENAEQLRSPTLNLSFTPGVPAKTFHHYWAESLAAFSLEKTREQLLQSDPKIHAILDELSKHPEMKINARYLNHAGN